MKMFKIIFLFTSVFLTEIALAQQSEKIVVPLSQPGKGGTLEVNLINGSIKVTGYNGTEVIVNAVSEDDERKEGKMDKNEAKREKREAQGLKRISNNSMDLNIEENDNHVEIRSGVWSRGLTLNIMVPLNFTLKLSAVNDGDITVENVKGEIEANNVNGDVFVKDIAGSAVVNTVNGLIEVNFKEIGQDKPMAFTTINGDINVTLPGATKASFKMQSEMGEMFSDFELQATNAAKVEKGKSAKGNHYRLENWVRSDINGGGPEYLFKTMHGDIFIRKRK